MLFPENLDITGSASRYTWRWHGHFGLYPKTTKSAGGVSNTNISFSIIIQLSIVKYDKCCIVNLFYKTAVVPHIIILF